MHYDNIDDVTERGFDYVVIGGGSAGAAVAARLSQDPDVTVALVEAGPDDRNLPEILQLDRWMELLESGYDWDYPVEPQENGNSFMRHARAKVMGGCSSHNSCIAFWAPREDLDEWESKYGATGWTADAAWPLYRRLETNEDAGPDAPHHGDSGPVHLMNVPRRILPASRSSMPANRPAFPAPNSTPGPPWSTAPTSSRSTAARTAPGPQARSPTSTPSWSAKTSHS
ncbi:choline oxidase [Arthrobacter sp. Hiyo4]|nr:choline oxidase [Arthrobacter sp. Hiyo4]